MGVYKEWGRMKRRKKYSNNSEGWDDVVSLIYRQREILATPSKGTNGSVAIPRQERKARQSIRYL